MTTLHEYIATSESHTCFDTETGNYALGRLAAGYRDATRKEKAHGAVWYRRANEYARQLSHFSGLSLAQVAAIIARLSPQVHWETNRLAAIEICTRTPLENALRCYGRNVSIAEAIRDGAPVSQFFRGATGPKITAFFSNVYAPETSNAVTVDSWA